MRALAFALLLTVGLACEGCFQSATLITVNGDGSGTLQQTLLFSGAALIQMRQVAPLTGGSNKAFDPFSEEQARQLAPSLGPNVRYVSSTPITTGEGLGRTIVYAFSDINQLRLNEQPPAPGGVTIRSKQLNTEQNIRFVLAPQPDGHVLLRILVPQPPEPAKSRTAAPLRPSPEEIATMKETFAGARLSIAVRPSGEIVRTSSPWVENGTVTLIDLDFDQLAGDDGVLARLRGVGSVEEAKAALSGVPGVKIPASREVTIEFTPKK
jgi:hypothetical protein